MLSGGQWRSRVAEAVDAVDFEYPIYRTLFEALADDAPDRLDETAARAYESLQAEGLGAELPDVMFERAVNWVEARQLDRELARKQQEIDLAPEADKARLTLEKKALANERNAKRPTWKIIEHARRKGAPGS